MPDLTYDATIFPITDATEVTAANLRALTYDESTPAQAWSLINGLLDSDNFVSTLEIEREHVQRGAWVDAGGIGGTANMDYRWSWFGSHDSTAAWTGAAAQIGSARPIPGACVSFHVPKTSLVRLAWTVMWTNDNNDGTDDYRSRIFLKTTKSAAYAQSQVRAVTRTDSTAGRTSHEGYAKNRVWSGHHVASFAPGYHSAGLYILGDNNIRQSRVWARNMSWVRMTS